MLHQMVLYHIALYRPAPNPVKAASETASGLASGHLRDGQRGWLSHHIILYYSIVCYITVWYSIL